MKYRVLSNGLIFEYLFLFFAGILALAICIYLEIYSLVIFFIISYVIIFLTVFLPQIRAYISINEKGVGFSIKKEKYHIVWDEIQQIVVTRGYKYRNGFKAICIYRKGYRTITNFKISNRDYIIVGYKKKIIVELNKYCNK